jgi:hypothetical protein
MLRNLKTANVQKGNSWPETGGESAANSRSAHATSATVSMHGQNPASAFGAGLKTRSGTLSSTLKDGSEPPAVLSIRAENVLKVLAPELTGETPPKGRWIPPAELLRKLGYSDLLGARNCGPQTIDEILRWARSQGVVIKRPFHAGKSLSAMWRDIIAKSSTQEYTMEEIAEALERSIRRKNTRIPVAFQSLLMALLNAAGN